MNDNIYPNKIKLEMKCNRKKLTLFDMGMSYRVELLNNTNNNFAVIAPMIVKFGTGVKLVVFYNDKKNVMSLLLPYYDVITCILADV